MLACSWRTCGASNYLPANSAMSLQTGVRAFILKSVVGFLSAQNALVTCLFIPPRQQCHLDIDILCASARLGLSTM